MSELLLILVTSTVIISCCFFLSLDEVIQIAVKSFLNVVELVKLADFK